MTDVRKIITLKVKKGKERDIGKNIIRIDPKTMEELNIQTGDVISLKGKKETAGIAWPSYPQDHGLGIVRFDSRLRKNTGSSIDDTIEIQKVNAAIAKTVLLAPASVKIKSNPRFETFVRRKLINYPITIDDLIYISIGISRELLFRVKSLRPKGVCIIKQNSVLHISDEISLEEETRGEIITYEDIGGLDKEIQQIKDVIELPTKHPSIFNKLGIKPSRGILIIGPPGVGKTFLIRAIANESQIPYRSISGPEILSKYKGDSEKKLRKLFRDAETDSPSIIFIDQIDSITQNREHLKGKVEYSNIVSQFISLMDGLETSGKIIVIGETNRPDDIDPALRRSGRFDVEIKINPPDKEARQEIFRIHTKDMSLVEEISLKELADKSEDFVGADIARLCRLAGLNAIHRLIPEDQIKSEIIDDDILDDIQVSREDFELALKKIKKE